MTTVTSDGPSASALKKYLRQRRAELEEADFLTIVIPEILGSRSMLEIARRPGVQRLKASLLAEPGVQVLNLPVLKAEIDTDRDQAQEPVRNHVIVLVSSVNNATLTAIEYAETLHPTDIRAVTFSLDAARSEELGISWLDARVPHPLEIEDSPFRDIGTSLVHYVRQFRPNGTDRVVTVIIPEFVVHRLHHHLLHGQTALLIKRRLLFEPGVVVVSVPYKLED